MVCSTSFFSSTTCSTKAFVQLPNRSHTEATHIGTMHLSNIILLTSVFCVPFFSFNLLSASKLTHESSLCLFFWVNFVLLRSYLHGQRLGLLKSSMAFISYFPTLLKTKLSIKHLLST